jgi:hypothetical protein
MKISPYHLHDKLDVSLESCQCNLRAEEEYKGTSDSDTSKEAVSGKGRLCRMDSDEA